MNMTKAMILAGGKGSRLYPATSVVSKQNLNVADKPMCFYPMHALMLAGFRDVLIISTPEDLPTFQALFSDGSQLGMKISYAEQKKPNGLAEAFIIGYECGFLKKNDPVCLILGDNIFHSAGLTGMLKKAKRTKTGATIFGVIVNDPDRFGVVEFDDDGNILSLEEKPKEPKSEYAVPGLYFYGPGVVDRSYALEPSARGELEITDLNKTYLEDGTLKCIKMPLGMAWADTGTHEALHQASSYVLAFQSMTGTHIACLEEIAYHNGWIDEEKMKEAIHRYGTSSYSHYLRRVLKRGRK